MTYRVVHQFDMAGWTYRPGETFTDEELAARGATPEHRDWALRRSLLAQDQAPAAEDELSPAPEPDEG
jgi:hypothetical protein